MAETTTEDEEQASVERTIVRSAIIGGAIGAVVCAGIWILIVVLAVSGTDGVGGMLLVGAACGVFAGLFLGGSAGTLIGASHLEHHEHEVRARERRQREAAISR